MRALALSGQRSAALTRGPLVYCLESIDNPGVDIFTARLNQATLRAEYEPQLLGGVEVLRAQTNAGQALISPLSTLG